MENTTQTLNDIDVIVVSPEEASFGVAELWSGGREIAFTRMEDGELALRIGPSHDTVLGANALAGALAKANELLARY
jgi:hypothetical protein